MSIIEKLKEVRIRFGDNCPEGSEGTLYLLLLLEWNYLGRKQEVHMADEELKARTGLGRYAIRNARRGLARKGYISYKLGNGTTRTRYTIL